MAPDHFDRHIKSKLYHLETEVPDQIWAQIDSQLRPPKDRRWIWWFTLLILTSSSIVGYILLSQYSWIDNPSLAAETNVKIPAPDDNQATADALVSIANPGVEGASVKTQVDKREPTTQYASLLANKASKDMHSETADLNTVNQTTKDQRDSNLQETFTTVERRSRQKNAIQPAQIRPDAYPSRLTHSPSLMAANQSIDSKNHHQANEIQVATMLSNTGPKDQVENLAMHFDKDAIRNARSDLIWLDHRDLKIVEHLYDPQINICPSFRAKTLLRPFVEITLAGGAPVRTLKTLNAEVADYRALRNRTEKIRGLFAIQGLVGVDIGRHWEAKAGVSFTQINEVFDFIDESASRTIVNIITDTITVDGQQQVRSDTSIVTEYGQRIKLTNNHFRFIDIPILAGYRFKVKDHGFILQAGTALNLAFWKEADMLSPDEMVVNVDSKNDNQYPVFRSRAGLDLVGEVGYEVNISELNCLRIVASLRHPLFALTLADYPLEQKYNQIKLGLSWKHYLW